MQKKFCIFFDRYTSYLLGDKMKISKKYLLLIGIFVAGLSIGLTSSFLFFRRIEPTSALSIQTIKKEETITEKKIEEKGNQYKIRIYYPYTSYSVLNQEMEKFVQKQLQEFKQNMKKYPLTPLQFYTLDISYQTYIYKDYVTYVFEIFLDTGGAHPNTYIHSISYNRATDKIITIDTLNKQYPNILNILSLESRKSLMKSKKLKEVATEERKNMIDEGTAPTLDNFRNFAFTENGLTIFFENYQVAPYVYGSFEVTIPYSILKIDT